VGILLVKNNTCQHETLKNRDSNIFSKRKTIPPAPHFLMKKTTYFKTFYFHVTIKPWSIHYSSEQYIKSGKKNYSIKCIKTCIQCTRENFLGMSYEDKKKSMELCIIAWMVQRYISVNPYNHWPSSFVIYLT